MCSGAVSFGLVLPNQSGVLDVSVSVVGDGEGIEAEGFVAGAFFFEGLLPGHSHGIPPQKRHGTTCFGKTTTLQSD